MLNDNLTNLTNKMKEKIGEENMALISEEISEIVTDNTNTNNLLNNNKTEIEDLKNKNANLVNTNGILMQKIGTQLEQPIVNNKTENKKTEFNLKNAFDEKGNFKRNI